MAGTTQPIKSREDVERLKAYYRTVKPNARNYALIVVALNTALRISDILSLRWKDVYDFNRGGFRERFELREKKTGKKQSIPINDHVQEALAQLFEAQGGPLAGGWLFVSQKGGRLSREQAFRVVTSAAAALNLGEHISCHSLRKTFGYHAYKMGVSPSLLVELYNHSSYQVTKRYLGLGQDEKDEVYMKINL